MRSNVGEVAVMARHGLVNGVQKNGVITSIRLLASVHAVHRVLRNCKAGSDARPLSITPKRSCGLSFPDTIDGRRAKLGVLGGYRRMSIGQSTREVTC